MSSPSLGRTAPLILIALWLVGMVGIVSIPLERHGVFVLETAQEMQVSGDWILPRFNGEPRLNKPPLNYWATTLVAQLDPFHADVQIWHGRLVSLLAALALGLATYRAGTRLYGRTTGFLAALILASSEQLVEMAHNSRPDMLYAACCALLLFAWLDAWRAADGSRSQCAYGLAGWLAAALATLAKGPQVPAVFLAGFLIFLLTGPDRRRVARILHPIGGLLLYCAIVLPWWILLNRRLESMGIAIEESQMSGSLLRNLAQWDELLSAYYLWALPLCMLPASLAMPFVARRLWKKRKALGPSARLLLVVGATWLVVFTLGGHYRSHYLLPILPLPALALARALLLPPPLAALPRKWWMALRGITGAAVLACAGTLLYQGRIVAFILTAGAGGLLYLLVRRGLNAGEWTPTPLVRQLVVLLVLCAVAVAGGNALLPLHARRAAEQALAVRIRSALAPGDRLVQWNMDKEVLAFYHDAPIPTLTETAELEKLLTRSGKPVFAVVHTRELDGLGQSFGIEILDSTASIRKQSQHLSFVQLGNGPERPEEQP
ncbi:ArnT family glycosyltransferase [Pontiella sp.]|uniref:ArnT family glycosyltransferase n=1 Tax=Pontiella sp. TaxID=2837462 RepID=UPI0035643A73